MKYDLYDELKIDIVKNCRIDMFTAKKIVDFLKQEGHINHDSLKDYYKGEKNEV